MGQGASVNTDPGKEGGPLTIQDHVRDGGWGGETGLGQFLSDDLNYYYYHFFFFFKEEAAREEGEEDFSRRLEEMSTNWDWALPLF